MSKSLLKQELEYNNVEWNPKADLQSMDLQVENHFSPLSQKIYTSPLSSYLKAF